MSKRILIIDDIDFMVEFEGKLIDALSQEVGIVINLDTANTVEDALKLIEENDYDAMIIDMHLPDGSGLDIAKAAIKKNSETRIAALTIFPKKYEEHRAYFDAFFKKPILPTSYKQNVRYLLHI